MNAPLSRRDRLIPWYFVLFFVVIALIDGVMVTLAVRSYQGTVTDHPYEKGLAYNTVVEAANAQAARGWKGALAYTGGALHFTLRDASGTPLAVAETTATLTRPTQAGMDFSLPLVGEATPITFPAPGVWDVRVDATIQGVHYQHHQRVVVEQ